MSDPSPSLTAEQLQEKLDEVMQERDQLRDAVNRWQVLGRVAMGNLQKIVEEQQRFLRDGILPE